MANMSKNQTTGKYELNITPSTSTQTKTIKVGGKYSDADISISVSAIPNDYLIPSGIIEVTAAGDAQWSRKTWSGISSLAGKNVWTDGENIYSSVHSEQKVLNKTTGEWENKTWYGLTNFLGQYIWSDGDNIYYSYNENQYILDKTTSTWSEKNWNGLTDFSGNYVWADGTNVYYSLGSTYQKVLNGDTWENKTWSGLTSFSGNNIWSDGTNIYYSNGNEQYILNKENSSWNSCYTYVDFNPYGHDIWTDGENIYYSHSHVSKILDKENSTSTHLIWLDKYWDTIFTTVSNHVYIDVIAISGEQIWSDGTNFYYSAGSASGYVLTQNNYDDVTNYKYAYVPLETIEVKSLTGVQFISHSQGKLIGNVKVSPVVLEDKSVSPTTNEQIITASEGYDALSSVVVGAIPSTYVEPTGNIELTQQSGTNVTDKATASVRSASSFSLAITDQPTTNITVGSISSGYYPLTASLTGTFSASTAGWFSSGSATDNSVIVGRIPASTRSTSDERITPYAWSIDTSEDSIDRYYNFTEGYTKPGYIKIRARTNGSFNNAATSGVTYTENTDATTVIPAQGYLYLNAGYFPNTKISLAHLIPDPEANENNPGNGQLLSGYVAYDKDGKKLVGTIATVTPTFTGGTPSLTDKSNSISVTGMATSNSATSYYIDAQASAKATRTAVTYANNYTGYIDKASGTEASAAATEANAETINANRIYIQEATPSAEISSYSAPSVSISGTANGFTASSSATSYYVELSGSASTGWARAKYTNSTAGYAPENTSGTEGTGITIPPSISGSGNKVYIPEASWGTSNSGTNRSTITPGTSTKYVNVTAGYTSASKVTISGSSNLVASNIKSGVSIFGVTGNYQGETKTVSVSASTSQIMFALGELTITHGNKSVTINNVYFKIYSISSGSFVYSLLKDTSNTSSSISPEFENITVSSTGSSASSVTLTFRPGCCWLCSTSYTGTSLGSPSTSINSNTYKENVVTINKILAPNTFLRFTAYGYLNNGSTTYGSIILGRSAYVKIIEIKARASGTSGSISYAEGVITYQTSDDGVNWSSDKTFSGGTSQWTSVYSNSLAAVYNCYAYFYYPTYYL